MNKMTPVNALSAAIVSALLSLSAPAFADSMTGTVAAFDRLAGIIVMTDKSIFSLDGAIVDIPPNLSAGDKITVDFEGDEDGISAINSIVILTEGDQS